MTFGCNTQPFDLTRFLCNLDAPEIEPTNDELDEIDEDIFPDLDELVRAANVLAGPLEDYVNNR